MLLHVSSVSQATLLAFICKTILKEMYMLIQVGTVAINDGIILESCMYRILKNHFRSTPYYTELLDLFHEVSPSSFACKHNTASQSRHASAKQPVMHPQRHAVQWYPSVTGA